MLPMNTLHHSLHWQFNPTLYSSQCPKGPDRKKKKPTVLRLRQSFPTWVITSVQEKKSGGQLPVPNSSDCPNTIAQPAPDQAHHLLTRMSRCQAQHLIHPTTVLIPQAFYSKTSGWIPPPPFRTCGCLAHINCNSFGLDVMFFTGVRPLTSFASSGEGRVLLPPSSLPFRLGVVYWSGKRS